jgi:hypothetical protein
MAVLCFFASREMALALHAEFRSDARSLEDRTCIMLDLFPDALKAYADIGRSLATGEHVDTEIDAVGGDSDAAETIEPCLCGSGRAQRVCCGAHRVLH